MYINRCSAGIKPNSNDVEHEDEEEYDDTGEADESCHEGILDEVDDEDEEEQLRNEPCDDSQAVEVEADFPHGVRAPTPLERIEEENLIELD